MASCWRTSRRGLVWAKESTLHPSAQEIVRAAPAATTRSRRGFNQRKQKSQGQVPTPALLAWFARLIKFCATSSLRDASSGELIVRQARPCLTGCDQHVKNSGNLFSDGTAMAVSNGIQRNQEELRCASIQPE
jgi:hypothetical protein